MSLAKLAILGALMEKPMHGYELKQYFEHAPGVFWMINYGSIYPALKKLEEEGLVKGRAKASGTARPKIIYRITKSGEGTFRKTLKERLKKDAFVRDEFTLHLFFMDFLDKKTIKQMIKSKLEGNARILEIVKEHEKIHKCKLPKYRCEVLKRGKLHLKTEISWLNNTLKEIEKEAQ
jgi:DNA-binding PadR family transcriptional regulator